MRASAFERLTLEYSEPLDSLSYIARSSLGSIGGIALVLALCLGCEELQRAVLAAAEQPNKRERGAAWRRTELGEPCGLVSLGGSQSQQ